MRLLLLSFFAACLLTVVLRASDKEQPIQLRYVVAADTAEAIARQLGAEAASAIVSTDPERNAITLRADHPDAAKVRNLIASLDHKPEQLKLAMTVTRKTDASRPPAQERVLARPTIIGLPGKPMIVTFEKDGETIQIEINATVLKP